MNKVCYMTQRTEYNKIVTQNGIKLDHASLDLRRIIRHRRSRGHHGLLSSTRVHGPTFALHFAQAWPVCLVDIKVIIHIIDIRKIVASSFLLVAGSDCWGCLCSVTFDCTKDCLCGSCSSTARIHWRNGRRVGHAVAKTCPRR